MPKIYRDETIPQYTPAVAPTMPTFTPAAAPTYDANKSILTDLLKASDYNYNESLKRGMTSVGDAMQTRRMRNSGIHAATSKDLLMNLLAQKTAQDQGNALNVANFGLNEQQLEQALNIFNQGQQQQLGMFGQSQGQNLSLANMASQNQLGMFNQSQTQAYNMWQEGQQNQQAAQNAQNRANLTGSLVGMAGMYATGGMSGGGGEMSLFDLMNKKKTTAAGAPVGAATAANLGAGAAYGGYGSPTSNPFLTGWEQMYNPAAMWPRVSRR